MKKRYNRRKVRVVSRYGHKLPDFQAEITSPRKGVTLQSLEKNKRVIREGMKDRHLRVVNLMGTEGT